MDVFRAFPQLFVLIRWLFDCVGGVRVAIFDFNRSFELLRSADTAGRERLAAFLFGFLLLLFDAAPFDFRVGPLVNAAVVSFFLRILTLVMVVWLFVKRPTTPAVLIAARPFSVEMRGVEGLGRGGTFRFFLLSAVSRAFLFGGRPLACVDDLWVGLVELLGPAHKLSHLWHEELLVLRVHVGDVGVSTFILRLAVLLSVAPVHHGLFAVGQETAVEVVERRLRSRAGRQAPLLHQVFGPALPLRDAAKRVLVQRAPHPLLTCPELVLLFAEVFARLFEFSLNVGDHPLFGRFVEVALQNQVDLSVVVVELLEEHGVVRLLASRPIV